jgi:hypothetical protein
LAESPQEFAGGTSPAAGGFERDPVTLVELVNRVVDRGVVLGGDLTISVADIDLLYVGLRLLLCSPDRLELRESVVSSYQPEATG